MRLLSDSHIEPVALRQTIERALDDDATIDYLLPMLERLQRIAREGTDERMFAERQLAELLLETEPWRAALYIRKLLQVHPNDDACWALMGLAQALLGNYHYASVAYRRALACDPGNPWYSHNLGHLLDVALNQPHDAIAHLKRAQTKIPSEPAIACSLAHALWRLGESSSARNVLAPLLAHGAGIDPEVIALATEIRRTESLHRLRKKQETSSYPKRQKMKKKVVDFSY